MGPATVGHSLGVGFLQQGAPELVVVGRVQEDQAVPEGGQSVIDHHVQPLAVLPELLPGWRRKQGVSPTGAPSVAFPPSGLEAHHIWLPPQGHQDSVPSIQPHP